MAHVANLGGDIYDVLDPSTEHQCKAGLATTTAIAIADELKKATEKRDKPRVKGKLWASDIGKPCLRQHWYNFNEPQYGDKIDGHTKFKFLYGNLLEEAVLHYAVEAGHTVTETQARVEVQIGEWAVSGRIDAIIDDTLIDVKTTSSYGYKKYTTDGLDFTNDSFGYLYQLGFYKAFGDFESKDDVGFVWIDKQNGHIAYRKVQVPTKHDVIKRVEHIIEAVDMEELNVPRAFKPEPYGKSGNEKLGIGCSYCPFKQRCHRDANGGVGLRGFLYSHGPVWFTEITRPPNQNIMEIK